MSSFQIKLLAIIFMIFDHVGLFLFQDVYAFRLIGRLSFPLFAWMLANGFVHTRNQKAYLKRLLLFAVVSQLPYSLAFGELQVQQGGLNIFFTLSFGLLSLVYIKAYRYKAIPIIFLFAFLAEKLKFDYTNGSYGISMSYVNWRIFLSNEFIEWYNIQFSEGNITDTYNILLSEGVLQRGVINNNRFFYDRKFKGLDYSSFVGKKVCTFKGEEVLLKIRDLKDKDNTNNLSNFINSNLAEHIYKCILQVVNYKYGNSNTETQTSGTRKEVIFL